jgi:hypothetical protein
LDRWQHWVVVPEQVEKRQEESGEKAEMEK